MESAKPRIRHVTEYATSLVQEQAHNDYGDPQHAAPVSIVLDVGIPVDHLATLVHSATKHVRRECERREAADGPPQNLIVTAAAQEPREKRYRNHEDYDASDSPRRERPLGLAGQIRSQKRHKPNEEQWYAPSGPPHGARRLNSRKVERDRQQQEDFSEWQITDNLNMQAGSQTEEKCKPFFARGRSLLRLRRRRPAVRATTGLRRTLCDAPRSHDRRISHLRLTKLE